MLSTLTPLREGNVEAVVPPEQTTALGVSGLQGLMPATKGASPYRRTQLPRSSSAASYEPSWLPVSRMRGWCIPEKRGRSLAPNRPARMSRGKLSWTGTARVAPRGPPRTYDGRH